MALSDHVVLRWLERVRGIKSHRVVANMHARGWRGVISEADVLWWLENRLALDVTGVHDEIEAEIARAKFAGAAPSGSLRLATPRAQFIAADRGGSIEIMTVLTPRPASAKAH